MATYSYRIYSAQADRYASSLNATYLTARAATSGSALNTTTLGRLANSLSGSYTCAQTFFVYDTSAVPSGPGTGSFAFDCSTFSGNVDADTLRFREASSVANKIAGASFSGLAQLCDPGTFPTGTGLYTASIPDATVIPRQATLNVLMHSVREEAGTAPTGLNIFEPYLADQSGTTNDPYLDLNITAAWDLIGVSNSVEVTGTSHALVTTGISGLQAGDLLVACISSRIASTTAVTLPAGWLLVEDELNNNTLTTTSAQASATMAYCIRGASDPALTFTHPTAPSVALGRIVAYRYLGMEVNKDTQSSFTTGTVVTAISGTGLTTGSPDVLLVGMRAGGQESTLTSFAAATSPTSASGATDTTTDPVNNAWTERADANTTTGADTALSIYDAVKTAAGSTGNFTATASAGSGHSVVVGAFKVVLLPHLLMAPMMASGR